MIIVRPEHPADAPAVRAVNTAAFEGPAEADLVDALRGDPRVVSLVATLDGRVVGHALFTPVRIETPAPVEGPGAVEAAVAGTAIALGPLAVHPDHQRRGIGARLARAGLEACRARGHDLAFVLGHPEYYPRFGFRPSAPLGLRCAYPVPDDVFMVVELAPEALAGRAGVVRYLPAFDGV